MTLLAAALAAGWPLLQAAVAAGAEDALDALSRSFGYVNQRIGSFVALAGFAWLEGMIGIVLMDFLAAGVIRLDGMGPWLDWPCELKSRRSSAEQGRLSRRFRRPRIRSGWAW